MAYNSPGYIFPLAPNTRTQTVGSFDTNFTDFIAIGQDQRFDLDTSRTSNEVWFHFRMYKKNNIPSVNPTTPWLQIFDSMGILILEIDEADNYPNHPIRYRDGGSLITAPSAIFFATGPSNMDIRIITNGFGTGLIEVYNNETLIWQRTSLTNSVDLVGFLRIQGLRQISAGFNDFEYMASECLVSEGANPTVGTRVYSKYPKADGTLIAWTGTFTDVDDPLISTDGLVNTAAAAALRHTYIEGNLVSNSVAIDRVWVHSTAIDDGLGAFRFQHSIRIAGVNYDDATVVNPGALYNQVGYFAEYITDPSTAGDWTVAGINAAEFGYISV